VALERMIEGHYWVIFQYSFEIIYSINVKEETPSMEAQMIKKFAVFNEM
jgi:hypothetical protein